MIRPGELVVDSFAGGGGASLGISWALGRGPDIAINHDREAIALHAANHPESQHYAEDVWKVDPVEACAGRPVGLMWLSPDCKHFSKAKGGKPVSPRVRGLAWIAIRWAKAVKPRVMILENVEEFQTWGPLGPDDRPDPERKGRTFKAWVTRLRNLGYEVEWKELRADRFNTPTIRKRLFIIARCDGAPIVWPETTNGPGKAPVRAAAECIDWTIPAPSIFERKRPLAENTNRRIARGIKRFVIDNPRPFIVPMQHQNRPVGVDEPLQTITTQGNKFNLVTPTLVEMAHGGKERALDLPMTTIATEKGGQRALVAPIIAPLTHHGADRGQSPADPLATVTGAHRGEQALVTPVLVGVGGRAGCSPERPLDRPAATVTSKADTAIVAPVLVPRYGERDGQEPRARSVEDPMPTVVPTQNGAAVVAPMLVQTAHGERDKNGKKRGRGERSVNEPLGAVLATGNESIVSAFLARHNTERHPTDRPGSAMDEAVPTITTRGTQLNLALASMVKLKGTARDGARADEPLHTIAAEGTHHALSVAHLSTYYGEKAGAAARGQRLDDPLATQTTENRHALVRAFLVQYYSEGSGKDPRNLELPLPAITTRDRFGLVTVEGHEYVIVDIGMRMLVPRELYRAQGFPDSYRIEIDYNGKPLTKTAQVRMCGNSVCPPMAEALVRANLSAARAEERAA